MSEKIEAMTDADLMTKIETHRDDCTCVYCVEAFDVRKLNWFKS